MNAKQLKDSILQYAMQGKLSPLQVQDATILETRKFMDEKNSIPKEEEAFDLPKFWKWFRIGEVLKVSSGKNLTKKQMKDDGVYPVYGGNGICGHYDQYNVEANTIIIGRVGFYCGAVHVTNSKSWITDNALIVKYNEEFLTKDWIELALDYTDLSSTASATAQPVISGKKIYPLLIPVPPVEEQLMIKKRYDYLMGKIVDFGELQNQLSNMIDKFPFEIENSILQFAVQGKLLEQDPNDEPASQLIERIKEDKARLIEQKVIKKEKALPLITEDELPFEIPDTWEWVSLNDISSYIQRGKSPTYSSIEEVPVVSQKCIQWSGFTLEPAKFIDPKTVDNYDEIRFLKDGDLLWNSTGLGTVGRINRYSNKEISFDKVVVDSHVTIVRTSELINSEFIYYYLASPQIQEAIGEMCTGSTKQKELNTSTIKNVLIPLPPINEQNRIVIKIKQMLSVVDQLN